jgi:hypothetical protein
MAGRSGRCDDLISTLGEPNSQVAIPCADVSARPLSEASEEVRDAHLLLSLAR